MSESSLIVYSNTGRQFLFDKKDIVMPVERFSSLRSQSKDAHSDEEQEKHEDPHVSQWFVKQWEVMKGFYISRLEKEYSLQKLSLEEFTNKIADAVERRWLHHKEKQREAKRKKRQREAAAENKQNMAVLKNKHSLLRVVIVTNFIAFESFVGLDLASKGTLIDSLAALLVPFGPIEGSDIVADDSDLSNSEPHEKKGGRSEEIPTESKFDDRLALRVAYVNPESATSAVAGLNGKLFLPTGRSLLCEYLPIRDSNNQEAVSGSQNEGESSHEKSFMDLVEEELVEKNGLKKVD